jgi:hypothetical protein
MKKLILISLLLAFILPSLSAQSSKVKKDPVGTWKFEAPYAPEEYKAGKIEVTLTDKKYSATMGFSGSESKMAGDRVKFESDTLSFSISLEGQDVTVKLGFIDESKMAGKAVYTEGAVPLSLTRENR